MVTIANLIAAQDKARAARAALLASAPDSPAERRALARSLRADRVYGRCLEAYMAQHGADREAARAHIAAERRARADREAA
jgi:hypothetical protein